MHRIDEHATGAQKRPRYYQEQKVHPTVHQHYFSVIETDSSYHDKEKKNPDIQLKFGNIWILIP